MLQPLLNPPLVLVLIIILPASPFGARMNAGVLRRHLDNDKSWACILSAGCTVKFSASTPALPTTSFLFECGDAIVFDASPSAEVFHAVEGVERGTCPHVLSPLLETRRIGVVVRGRVEQ
uniref:Alpha-ketoglutarate-dependent dioxygenase AlkB-like domain-containing protein n=1 Tax=Palpitomonas bilix TaxID=652834 RepID=A0A7S3CWM6_9EUKA|mmetsp:Transcript_12344/g.33079  ORF Transcript_12344/g.33079 Transcript_12344/m.33079 type:complete len:120 (+) Transcript_12344:423-782(+)